MSLTIGVVGTTLLNLHGPGVPPYSARGLSQTLEPIDESLHVERDIDGGLIDFGYEPFQKYKSTITGSDQQPPAVDGVWSGQIITVDCMVELCCKISDYDELGRIAVLGSLRTDGDFAFYRPKLEMMVVGFSIDRDEWQAQVGWKLELEEV